jgi:RNA polymerase sigma-70 factor, ECF subfamily
MAPLSYAARDELLAFYDVAFDHAWRYLNRITGGDRALTEDLVQDVMVAVARDLKNGRSVRHDGAWVVMVARSRFLDYVRRASRDELRIAKATDRSSYSVNPDATDRARELLACLPIEQRAAVALRHLDGYSIAEIADQLGRSVSATESLIARGVKTLRKLEPETN